jgi:hypothetical protein
MSSIDASKRRRRIEFLVIAVCVLLVPIICISWLFITSENFGKPLGRDLPDEPPVEANRVVHPQGFSLVYPPNWDVSVSDVVDNSINGYPRSLLPRRHSGVIYVERIEKKMPGGLSDRRLIKFQGRTAYEQISLERGDWERPPYFGYNIIFYRNGDWYRIVYTIWQDRATLPAMILRYLETFRIESPKVLENHTRSPLRYRNSLFNTRFHV